MTREDLDMLVEGMVPAIKEYIDRRLQEVAAKTETEELRQRLADLETEEGAE